MPDPTLDAPKARRYYIGRFDAVLYWHDNRLYESEPSKLDIFRRITRDEYVEIRDRQEHYHERLLKYQGIHQGETVHVFGTGPSLKDFASAQDWSGKITIGVNAAGLHITPLKYWVSVDNLWDRTDRPLHNWIADWLKETKGKTIQFLRKGASVDIKVATPNMAAGEGWIPDEMFTQVLGPVSGIQSGLFWTLQSTHAALDLARHMNNGGKIVLWGVDLNDRSHAYTGGDDIKDDLRDNPGTEWDRWGTIERGYELLKGCTTFRQMLNANAGSRVKSFPFIDPEEAFKL